MDVKIHIYIMQNNKHAYIDILISVHDHVRLHSKAAAKWTDMLVSGRPLRHLLIDPNKTNDSGDN